MPTPEPSLSQTVLTLRAIIAALAGGVALFAGLALYLVSSRGAFSEELPAGMLLAILAALALGLASAWPLLAKAKLGQLARRHAGEAFSGSGEIPAALLREYTGLAIVKAAFVEGPSLFAVLIFLLTGSPWALAAAALGLALLISMWPSEEKVRVFAARVSGRLG